MKFKNFGFFSGKKNKSGNKRWHPLKWKPNRRHWNQNQYRSQRMQSKLTQVENWNQNRYRDQKPVSKSESNLTHHENWNRNR